MSCTGMFSYKSEICQYGDVLLVLPSKHPCSNQKFVWDLTKKSQICMIFVWDVTYRSGICFSLSYTNLGFVSKRCWRFVIKGSLGSLTIDRKYCITIFAVYNFVGCQYLDSVLRNLCRLFTYVIHRMNGKVCFLATLSYLSAQAS